MVRSCELFWSGPFPIRMPKVPQPFACENDRVSQFIITADAMITGDGPALISGASTGATFRGKLEHQAILQGTESWKFSDGNKTIMVHPQGRFKADSAIGITEAMAAGIGIAALPTVIAQAYVAAGRLAAIMTRYTLPEIGIFVVRPPGQHPSRKVRVLIDLLVKTFGAPE